MTKFNMRSITTSVQPKHYLVPVPHESTPLPPPSPHISATVKKTVAEPNLRPPKVNQKQTITNFKISGIDAHEMALDSSLAHILNDASFPYVIRPLKSVIFVGNERRRGPASGPTASSATNFRAYDLQHDQFASAVFVSQCNHGFLIVA